MIRNVRIRAARPADFDAIRQLLECCGLSANCVFDSSHLFHIAVLGKKIIGSACGARHGETIVIQDVGVLPEYRDQRIATHLVNAVLMRARVNGCTAAALITTSHPSYFARYGFSLCSSEQMPERVRLSIESEQRPGKKTYCMWRKLD